MAGTGGTRSPRVTFGADVFAALRRATLMTRWKHSNTVGTDDVIRDILELRSTKVKELVSRIPELCTANPVASATSDGTASPESHPDHSIEVAETSRELAWHTTRYRRRSSTPRPEWTDGLLTTLHETLTKARSAGVTRANSGHLILAALSNPTNRAATLFPDSRQEIVRRLRKDPVLRQDGRPYPSLADIESYLRPQPARKWGTRLLQWYGEPSIRLGRADIVSLEVLKEQQRQAVRMGHQTITIWHMLLAILDVERRMRAFNLRLPDALAIRNTGGRRLLECGFTFEQISRYAVWAGDNVELAASEVLMKRVVNGGWGDPLWSRAVVAVEDAAGELALTYRHPDCGTTHLLAALLAEAKDEITSFLPESDVAALGSRVREDLSGIGPAWAA